MGSNSPKIVVIGASYIEMLVRCRDYPSAGQAVPGTGFSYSITGPGPTEATQASLCDCQVWLISKVGGDPFGAIIRNSLIEYGVNCDYLYTAEAKNTGTSMTLVNSEGENASCVYSGANTALTRKDVEAAEQIIAEADVCLINGKLPQETVTGAVRCAEIQGTRTILDPAGPVDHGRTAEGLPIEYFNADIMIPNLYEAAQIAEHSAANYRAAKMIGSDIVARGTKTALITMGKRGCMVINRDHTEHIPAFEVELVDQTGTGDAFAGALAACYATTADIKEAVLFASAAGALACKKFGAIESLPTRSEIIELLQAEDQTF